MRALLVVADPRQSGFIDECATAAANGLMRAGHNVDVLDLYAIGFVAAMSTEERLAYDTDRPIIDAQVRDHADAVLRSEILVFVYPTISSGLPAIMKGWLERVLVPGVGFVFDEPSGKVRPGLRSVRRIVGISTHDASRTHVLRTNDNARRVLTRALRMSCGLRARPTWIAWYDADLTSATGRQRFLDRVQARAATL